MNKAIKYFSPFLNKNSESESQKTNKQIICLTTTILNYKDIFIESNLSLVGDLIDIYYSQITKMIINNNGDLNQFCGKSLIGFFDLDMTDKDLLNKIVHSATETLNKIIAINLNKEIMLRLGIGICLGDIIYGTFGSKDRKTVTGFGHPINCALSLSEKKAGINLCNSLSNNISKELMGINELNYFDHCS